MQSRYYDSNICRFINADIAEISKMSKDVTAGTNLFAYCNNQPINDSDQNGAISFVQIQSALSKAMSAVKAGIRKVLRKVGVWRSGNYLFIRTQLLAGAIDSIIMVGSAIKTVAIKSVFKVAIKFLKSNEKNFIKFLKKKLFPFIADNTNYVINYCLKSFAVSYGFKYSHALIKGKILDALFKNFYLYKWYNAFSSTGNIIANIFDIVTDWSWNGIIRIKLR